MKSNSTYSEKSSSGKLLAILTAAIYTLFTLLPDSSTLMVSWSWVFIWQVGLLCPILWLLGTIWQERRFPDLGNYLDLCVGISVIGLIVSTIFAEFPNQARWYSWSVIGFIAALYALNSWLNTPEKRYQLLIKQGYLNLAFIVISLSLWLTQTLLPELSRLNALKQYGITLPFDFSVLELRNWAPIGHQNYVAGYLLLALPLLVALSILATGKARSVWLAGIAFGLIDLYTTSSRGGWLGLILLCLVALILLIFRSSIPRLWLGLSGIGIIITISMLILGNNRLRSLIMAVFNGQGGGELAYRLINANIGWRMGSTHPFTGVGLGNVPILYQKYRPLWAGRESELAYQLHSTPAQLWAEMGLWGILPGLGAIACLVYLFLKVPSFSLGETDKIFCWCLCGAFFAYGVMSLTDFQLDNICISGTLVVFLAALASMFRVGVQPSQLSLNFLRAILLVGIGIILAVMIWLVPIHRAWQLSSQGFFALNQKEQDIHSFVQFLTKANQLAPWESYYSYQLGWNLGNIAIETGDFQLLQQGINWLEKGNAASPYQEFGHSNLAWLLLTNNPEKSTQELLKSINLVPAKRGLMYSLGLGLLKQSKLDLAVEAMSLEVLREPIFITSPIWRSPELQPTYPQVLNYLEKKYTELTKKYPHYQAYFQQCRGALRWWQGDLQTAQQDLEKYGTPLSKVILALREKKAIKQELFQLPLSPGKLVIEAWLNPEKRQELLQQAWILATKTPLPEEMKQQLLLGMEKSNTFPEWLQEKPLIWKYRRERAGFGVNSRHIDGVQPVDFFIVVENAVMTNWFSELFPSLFYDPELDLILQKQRDFLLKKLANI